MECFPCLSDIFHLFTWTCDVVVLRQNKPACCTSLAASSVAALNQTNECVADITGPSPFCAQSSWYFCCFVSLSYKLHFRLLQATLSLALSAVRSPLSVSFILPKSNKLNITCSSFFFFFLQKLFRFRYFVFASYLICFSIRISHHQKQ